MKNKVLGLILALAMVMSCLSITAFADVTEYSVKSAYADSQNIYVVFDVDSTIDQSNDLTQISVKSIKGESVTISSASKYKNVLTIPYTSSLKAGNSYYVILPDGFKSSTGAVVSDNAVRFAAPISGGSIADATSKEFDSSGIGTFGEVTANHEVVSVADMDSGHDYALHITTPSEVGYESTDKYVRYTNLNDSKYGYSDEVVVSTDYYFKSFSRTGNIKLLNTNLGGIYAYYFFDSYGNFVYLNGTGNNWSNEDKDSGYSQNHSVKTGLELNKWYTVKTVINKKDMTVKYYLGSYDTAGVYNEEYIATVPTVDSKQGFESNTKFSSAGNNVGELQIATYLKSGKKYIGDFYMDNIKMGYNINTGVATEIAKQSTTGTWAKFDFSSSAGGGTTYQNTNANSYSAATDKYGDEYVLSVDVHPSKVGGISNSVTIRCLAKASGYKINKDSAFEFKIDNNADLKMSKSLIDGWNDGYVSTESINVGKDDAGKINDFNIKLYVNKNNDKQVLVFINDKFFRAVTLYWSADAESSDLVSNYPGMANFVTFAYNYAKNEAHSNGVVGRVTEAIPEDITIKSGDNTYGIYTSNIPKSVAAITLDYKGKTVAAAFNAGTVTLKDSAGADVAATAVLSADGKSIVITPSQKLSNGKYTIAVKNIPCYDDFETNFVVNDSSKVEFTSFGIVKSDNIYTPSITVANSTDEQAEFVVIIGEYTNAEIPELVSIDYKTVQVAAGDTKAIDGDDLPSITTSETNTIIKSFIWDGISTLVPLTGSSRYSASAE